MPKKNNKKQIADRLVFRYYRSFKKWIQKITHKPSLTLSNIIHTNDNIKSCRSNDKNQTEEISLVIFIPQIPSPHNTNHHDLSISA